ncbi:Dynein light chain type 1 family protein putative isoform 2 [Tripterygium wilfordii]|uniref:Dynein light chain type 1 family protein putative isoform 2 n=1 Tax=Tripterygium wilfordii TaxID=458696 RepID=A0A7J7CKY2_TRIWF|nr:uncharacterized protein LOC120015909 [Tripterygium wilfordii]KAF5734725.1 Dynein light chain type 1 family protein putative isoform 2 [Tripterygium wilfordii]
MAKHLKRHSNPTKNPDPLHLPNQFLSIPNSHRLRPSIDINLQAKSMTVSADFIRTPNKKPISQIKDTVVEHKERRVKKSSSSSSSKELNKKKPQLEEGQLTEKKLISLDGRRRSFCGSQVELADVLANSGAKVVSFDMPPFMQIHAVNCARKTIDSLEKFTSKALALTLKKEFDGVYGPAWHCIVGTSFGSFVTHSVGGFLYFSMDQKLHILLFKTAVQRAD